MILVRSHRPCSESCPQQGGTTGSSGEPVCDSPSDLNNMTNQTNRCQKWLNSISTPALLEPPRVSCHYLQKPNLRSPCGSRGAEASQSRNRRRNVDEFGNWYSRSESVMGLLITGEINRTDDAWDHTTKTVATKPHAYSASDRLWAYLFRSFVSSASRPG
jgi:hypothetical protein